jgi:hypothetical protein
VPLLSSIILKQRARKVKPKRKGKNECEMVISVRRRYLYLGKHRVTTVMDVISIHVPSIECVASRTVRHAPVI